jgi:hypothetical protein
LTTLCVQSAKKRLTETASWSRCVQINHKKFQIIIATDCPIKNIEFAFYQIHSDLSFLFKIATK